MFDDRPGGRRRAAARAFRPSLDGGRLESRQLLTTVAALPKAHYILTHPSPGVANRLGDPSRLSNHAPYFSVGPRRNHGVPDVNTARGGQSAIVAMADGSRFRVSLVLADNQYDGGLSAETGSSATGVLPSSTVQPVGTVRVYPMPGNQVGIIVDGATQYQQLTIDPLPVAQRKGFAHSFAYGEAGRSNIMTIGSIQVNGGQLQAILGYHSAALAGPLTINGPAVVDRIAFDSILPGGSIQTGGTVNTLDVANNASFTAGPGVIINGDLNLLNVGGNLTIANGANFSVNRFVGLTPQPAKGTSTGSNILALNQSTLSSTSSTSLLAPAISANVLGNLIIGPGSVLNIGSGIAASSLTSNTLTGATTSTVSPFLVDGQLQVASANNINIYRLFESGGISNNFNSLVQPNALAALVARNGVVVNGVLVLPPA